MVDGGGTAGASGEDAGTKTPLSAARSTASDAPGGMPPSEEVVATRAGEVLLPHTLLKSDHFPGCQNTRLTPLIEGAPNFRQVPGLPVYGLAIPTVVGLRLVLDQLGAAKGRRKVLWHNMREEPVLYINGQPYVVREADKPFANLEYTGIDRWRVEGMEARLKQDVLFEAEQYGHQILVAHEDDQFQVVQQWEPVTDVDVQTPLEVYQELAADGYNVDYLRVPVTDEKAPKDRDFELLIQRCWAPPEGAALVFNCQMGRGRTTTGMVIGTLLSLKRLAPSLAPPPDPAPGLPSWFVAEQGVVSPTKAGLNVLEEAELKAGKFGVIRSLLRVLERGVTAKSALDCVLDACAAMQNLREAIASYRHRLYYEPSDARRASLLHVCLEYLERYFVLVAFAAYLSGPCFQPGGPAHVTFSDWWATRPELRSILDRLLRLNPLAALAMHRAPDALAGGEAQETADRREEEERAALISRRAGAVLGPYTLLKQDHFPGCQSSRLKALFPGAPNFREVPGVRVFGGAIATVQGMREVLAHVGAAPDAPCIHSRQAQAVWHLMREEPVVYINGRPYVLREASRPFKNLMEYRGIMPARLEQMEGRLRVSGV